MNSKIVIVGFAIFTMFFGAGNMVLPLLLAQKWNGEWPLAFMGFCLTGVFVTLLGLIGAVLARDIKSFFAPLGVYLGLLMQLVLICIEGPLGVVPRSFIVAFGGVKSIYPDASNVLFYGAACVVLYFLATNKTKIITVIGKYLTPLMLVFLAILIVFAIQRTPEQIFEAQYSLESFLDGLDLGYLTYDLPGAIYFTSIATGYFINIGGTKNEMLKNGIKASIISSVLLTLVYAAFIYLGITYHNLIATVPPEQILPSIIKGTMGYVSTYLFSLFVVLACLTTAVAAITIWTDFVTIYTSRWKVPYKLVLALSLFIAFLVATLDFSGLMKMLGPVLKVIYPILILLTIYNITTKLYDLKKQKKSDSLTI